MKRDGSEDVTAELGAFRPALENATVLSTAVLFASGISAALAHSVVGRTIAAFGRFARHSVLYRWLTEPPDEKIPIDLNDATFGVVVERLLVFVRETYPRAIRDSTATNRYRAVETKVRSAPLQLLGIGLVLVGSFGVVAAFATEGATARETSIYAALVVFGVLVSRITTPWDQLSNAKVVGLWRGTKESED